MGGGGRGELTRKIYPEAKSLILLINVILTAFNCTFSKSINMFLFHKQSVVCQRGGFYVNVIIVNIVSLVKG